jgi:hypothetical protein
MIERGNTVNAAKRQLKLIGDVDEQIIFEISEDSLRNVQDFDKGIAARLMFRNCAIQQLESIIATWVG